MFHVWTRRSYAYRRYASSTIDRATYAQQLVQRLSQARQPMSDITQDMRQRQTATPSSV